MLFLGLLTFVCTGAAATAIQQRNESTFDVELQISLTGDGSKTQPVLIRVHPSWAPLGAKQFKAMIDAGVLDGARFFRVVPRFVVQFGIPGDPKVAEEWRAKVIKDDPVSQDHPNVRGTVVFATGGPNTRTTQLFVNLIDNDALGLRGFTPIGKVVDGGMKVIDQIYAEYGQKPQQPMIQREGNKYLIKNFPKLSYIATAKEVKGGKPPTLLEKSSQRGQHHHAHHHHRTHIR